MLRASEGSPHFDIATSNNEDIAFRDAGPDGHINMFIEGTNGHGYWDDITRDSTPREREYPSGGPHPNYE